jgi:uncharacterized protein YjbI with pentapeptide repeats
MNPPSLGFARSSLEVDYWLRLHGCPNCGEHDIGEPRLHSTGMWNEPTGKFRGGILSVTCPRCAFHHDWKYFEREGFRDDIDYPAIAGRAPSTIITAREFATELQSALADVPVEFKHLDRATRNRVVDRRGHAHTSAIELLKFIPDGAEEIPDAAFGDDLAYKREHAHELTRAYLTEKIAYLADYLERMRADANQREAAAQAPTGKRRLPVPAFSLASIKLHEQWLHHPDEGDNQQLIAQGADATEMNLSARTLSKASMSKVTLDRANLSYAYLDDASLTQVSLRGTILENGSAHRAVFRDCHFEGADAYLWKLHGTQFHNCDFTRATLQRSVWTQAAANGCTFIAADLRNARLDEARFTDCNFRDADLSVPEPGINTARGARFDRCDFTGANWQGRDLDAVEFVDCIAAPAR